MIKRSCHNESISRNREIRQWNCENNYDLSATESGSDREIKESEDEGATVLLKYKLEFGTDTNDSKPNFKFTIVGGSKVTNSSYNKIVLQYDTQFVLSEMGEPTTNDGKIRLSNSMEIKVGNVQTASKTAYKDLDKIVSQNGRKIVNRVGNEDYAEGTRVFNWRAELNH